MRKYRVFEEIHGNLHDRMLSKLEIADIVFLVEPVSQRQCHHNLEIAYVVALYAIHRNLSTLIKSIYLYVVM